MRVFVIAVEFTNSLFNSRIVARIAQNAFKVHAQSIIRPAIVASVMIVAPPPSLRLFSANLTQMWHRHNHTSPADQATDTGPDQINQIAQTWLGHRAVLVILDMLDNPVCSSAAAEFKPHLL